MAWWCCKAEFGEHEPTCANYGSKPMPITPEELAEIEARAMQKPVDLGGEKGVE
jgi:hypothetical protein